MRISMGIMIVFMQLIFLLACNTLKPDRLVINSSAKIGILSPGIHHITAIKDIIPLFDALNEHDLVAWDVDSVILTTKDMIFRPISDEVRSRMFRELAQKYGSEKTLFVRSKALLETQWELVDSDIVPAIKGLQAKKVPTIALTAVRTNSFAEMRDPVGWRIDMLRGFGVNFAWPSPLLQQQWEGNIGYRDGVVASGEKAKGTVFLRFLEHAKWNPQKVVFIDDKIKNIENMRDECARAGIKNFYGFQFEAKAFKNDPKPDECMLKFQLEAVLKDLPWPTDQEAMENIKKGSFSCDERIVS